MKPRKPDESDAHYIKRLESQNAGLRQQNAWLAKWQGALNEAVTTLSTEGSLAFQAMAEKAGVRSHPSVTQAVALFDAVSHPQWRGDKEMPKIEWPTDWDFDGEGAWSGDADMTLNSPIAEAIELFDALVMHVPHRLVEPLRHVLVGLNRALRDGVDGVKDKHGFRPRYLTCPPQMHFRDMVDEELRDLASSLGWMALDLAQDMSFANEMLRRDLRAATYRRVCSDLYRMSQFACDWNGGINFSVKVFGSDLDARESGMEGRNAQSNQPNDDATGKA
jgi:hypothetical protein